MPCTSLTPLAATPKNSSKRLKCPLLNDWWTGTVEWTLYRGNSHVDRVQSVISLMMKGRNNGKKLLALRIVAHAFEIIHLLTDQNPIQVCLQTEPVV